MAAAEVQGPAQGPAMVVSISGLRDSTLLDVARFVAAMEQRGISPSLLIAPYSGKDWSLRQAPAVLDWVRRRCDDGMEVVLAGFDQSVRGRSAEFSALSPHEARLRLTAATRQMKMLGLHTDISPRRSGRCPRALWRCSRSSVSASQPTATRSLIWPPVR